MKGEPAHAGHRRRSEPRPTGARSVRVGPHDGLLELQRLAGNHAVVSLAGNLPILQRDHHEEQYNRGGQAGKAMLEARLRQIEHGYQDLLEKQGLGIDSLKSDLETPDQPSVAEVVLSEAVSIALLATTGFIGGVVANRAFRRANEKIQEASRAQLEASASDEARRATQAATNWREDLARSAADGVRDVVKGKIRELVPASAAGVRGKPAVEQFITTSRDSLIDTKSTARDAFIEREESFRADAFGLAQAEALYESLKEEKEKAPRQQYIDALSQWARLRTSAPVSLGEIFGDERPGSFVVKLDIPRPTAPVSVSGASWPGINYRTRKTLQDNHGDRTLWEISPPVLIMDVVTRQWQIFSGSESFRMVKRTGVDNVQFPETGTPLYWLAARGEGRDQIFSGQPNPFVALAAAHILWGEVMSRTIRQLGTIGD
jgi:hypothetical protein